MVQHIEIFLILGCKVCKFPRLCGISTSGSLYSQPFWEVSLWEKSHYIASLLGESLFWEVLLYSQSFGEVSLWGKSHYIASLLGKSLYGESLSTQQRVILMYMQVCNKIIEKTIFWCILTNCLYPLCVISLCLTIIDCNIFMHEKT